MISPPAFARWRCPLAALLAVTTFLVLVARFWHPVHGFAVFLDASAPTSPPAALRDPGVAPGGTAPSTATFYAQLAHDPALRDPELRRALADHPGRAHHILAPALAWLLGAGQRPWITHAYSLFNVGAWLALAAVLWRLLDVRDARGLFAWAGLLFSAGALHSVRYALPHNLTLALIAAAIFAAERWHGRIAVVLLAAAALAHEAAVLALSGLFKPPWLSLKNLTRVACILSPLVAWLLYVRSAGGPHDVTAVTFTLPGLGLLAKLRETLAALSAAPPNALAWTTLLTTVAIAAQAAFFITRRGRPDRGWRLGIIYTALLLCLAPGQWSGIPAAAPGLLLPLHLAFNLRAHRTRAPLAWLVLGNLSLFSGLLALTEIPRSTHDVTAHAPADPNRSRTVDASLNREIISPSAAELAFALYDPRLALAER